MARIPNAFKLRVADQGVLNTSLFLSLYSPIFLREELRPDDFVAPKLIFLNGSPGSGKSSLLRLFEASTLIDLCKSQSKNRDVLIEPLTEIGILTENRPNCFGIYIHCDSSLREIHNLEVNGANNKMLNTLLDVRIVRSFLTALKLLNANHQFVPNLDDFRLQPLPSGLLPPNIFKVEHSVETLRNECQGIERDFSTFLNSFPGETIPSSIQPHSRIFSISYLQHLIQNTRELDGFLPIVMLDDLHELYKSQRDGIKEEFLQRSAIPRWIAVRKQVYGLEELISQQEVKGGREFRPINLDSATPGLFRRFVKNVANMRLSKSSSLQPYGIDDFDEQLQDLDMSSTISLDRIKKTSPNIEGDLREFDINIPNNLTINLNEQVSISDIVTAESKLILWERHKNRRQRTLFDSFEEVIELDSKVKEAATLFAAEKYKIPYYYAFDSLAYVATKNVEQFLSVASSFVEKMISRAELKNDATLSAAEQEKLIKSCAENYYRNIEQRFQRGYAIRQLVDNLGAFFRAVTYRPSAPIAPGVNGFGFGKAKFRLFLESHSSKEEVNTFRDILTRAVAGNILFVEDVKQGSAGSEKIVFYLNRLLCVKYQLPLSTGGWQQIKPELIIRMMKQPVSPRDWDKSWITPFLDDDTAL